ncbi:hypothetical protein [Loktanella salsilacus]|uniref:hypothetical protein n=1 Tax=Loktanella salsilacus TaxID=195913 RepID=UPI0037358B4D
MIRSVALLATLGLMAACSDATTVRSGPQLQSPSGGADAVTPAAAQSVPATQQDMVVISDVSAMAVPTSVAETGDVVATFRTVCLNNLGDVQATRSTATALGFQPMADDNGGFALLNAGTDQTVQVNYMTNRRFECAVTTSDAADPATLRSAFFGLVGARNVKEGTTVASTINGKSFTFAYDTSGGEALVMYQ